MSLPYGYVFALPNGLHARVLLDDPAYETVLVTVIISGWGDPIRQIPRESVPDATATVPEAGDRRGLGQGQGTEEE